MKHIWDTITASFQYFYTIYDLNLSYDKNRPNSCTFKNLEETWTKFSKTFDNPL